MGGKGKQTGALRFAMYIRGISDYGKTVSGSDLIAHIDTRRAIDQREKMENHRMLPGDRDTHGFTLFHPKCGDIRMVGLPFHTA